MNISKPLTLDDILNPEVANIATLLEKRDVDAIGAECVEGFRKDKSSRTEWEEALDGAMKLALQVAEDRSFPWANASNIKFPLISIAALQFHARASSALLGGSQPVRCSVAGPDPDGSRCARAKRVETHMSFQLLEEDQTWEAHMDRTLITLPIVGTVFKKSYRDPVKNINRSIYVSPRDLVVNYWARDIDDAPRVTHVRHPSANEVYEMVARGIWIEPKHKPDTNIEADLLRQSMDDRVGITNPDDDSTPYTVLEMHTFLDLDGDGYEEPYIVWTDLDSEQVLCILPRFFSTSVKIDSRTGKLLSIEPESYFTKYEFIPSPDGSFYGIGFGNLLGPLNNSINTLVNQLTDAGTLSNLGGGFLARGAKIRGGNYAFAPGEWKPVDATGDDLRKSIVPLPVRDPSQVLFTLLDLLINYGERIAGSTDVMVGENVGQNTPAQTSQMMVEQGSKTFSAIYKRVYRALKQEFRKLYRLNQLYLTDSLEYESELAGVSLVQPDDYMPPATTVSPSADPNISSDTQRVQQGMFMMQTAQAAGGNIWAAARYAYQAQKIPDYIIDQVLGQQPTPQGPSEKMQIAQMQEQTKQMQLQMQAQQQAFQQQLDQFNAQMQAMLTMAQAKKAEAEAEAEPINQIIGMTDTIIGAKNSERDHIVNMHNVDLQAKKLTQAKPDAS